MLTINNKTFKEINKKSHTLICISDVKAIRIGKYIDTYDRFYVSFDVGNADEYVSDEFGTEEEALKFRNDVMGWGQE